jgi:hypothetical protein
MIVPMDSLKEGDIYELYIPEGWDKISPEYLVCGVGKGILLVKVCYPDERELFRFVKIFYNFNNYCTRVVVR